MLYTAVSVVAAAVSTLVGIVFLSLGPLWAAGMHDPPRSSLRSLVTLASLLMWTFIIGSLVIVGLYEFAKVAIDGFEVLL